ncbi:uncharacterized protein LOC125058190 isoform X1 [Pieris napi]|uniref:uncharacterized protein LOC125058190 isoform X1 n=1 Tax=Pieris napi TaxID=78633 RepID=UPI001FB92C9B|nr:uncharacterized protein LOC125058190 isoform X1 [Pieris napi]
MIGEAKPQLLIGADNWHLIVSRKVYSGKKNEPAASLTRLGWILHGTAPIRSLMEDNERVLHCIKKAAEIDVYKETIDERLEAILKQSFAIDALGINNKKRLTSADARAVQLFNTTIEKRERRYYLGLPWKTDNTKFPESYNMAFKRLKSIERKMDQSDEFKQSYTKQINNLLEKNYAHPVERTRILTSKEWYLPHFAVTNPNKPGKVRLVFDAAARSNEVCLNDELLDGPDLLQSLPGILLMFRERKYATTADIREMFLQIKVNEDDQVAQKFLWRGENRDKPPKEYVMTSLIFGAKSSPFLAHSVRDYNASCYRTTHPNAHNAITKNHYMDDYVDSFDTEDEAIKTMQEVIEVHSYAGFTLAGWNSNSQRIVEATPPELRSTSPKELGTTPLHYEKTLGISWEAAEDVLSFNTSLHRVPQEVKQGIRQPTKREALGAVMSVFDPLGLISYYTVTAKIILQQLWRLKTGWDEEIPTDQASEFKQWLCQLENVKTLKIPRWYNYTRGAELQLHVFCDASEQAHASVAYWRIGTDVIDVRLITAKARVAPIKSQSIPRLELQAALIGARLAVAITEGHRIEPNKIVLWTDSTTVLQWIRNDKARHPPFVAHRLTEITETTDASQWRWVPTRENVADDATRITLDHKTDNDRWFVGPAFLYGPEETWPKESCEPQVLTMTVIERRANRNDLPDIERFSQYERLIRATAYVQLFIRKLKDRSTRLSVSDLKDAEQAWVREAQNQSFQDEIDTLKKGKPIKKTSRLAKYDPFLDEYGLLRVRGRLQTPIAEETRNPILLDGRHTFTKLIVMKEHRRALHTNNERTEAHIRPFTNCGMDYFGPICVTIGRRHEKRWGAIFTCLSTRAVHIEIVASLSTDSALMALRRMAARRGWPQIIYSDNATNFKGADLELRKAMEKWTPEIENLCLVQRTEWRYIAPGAPHQGGAWERLIRTIKDAIRIVLTEKYPKEETFSTLMTEIEYSVNARPLTHVPVNPDDPEALTPNHFLLGAPDTMPILGTSPHVTKRTWKTAQALADEFWRRWVKEYLPTLNARGHTPRMKSPVKIGDVVIIMDPLLPRNVWPRGIVTKTHSGPDGETRSVEVETKLHQLRRPVTRIVVLPTESFTS